jgi:hypothetical protein
MKDVWIVVVCDEDFDMDCELFAHEQEARKHAANCLEEGWERVTVFNRYLPE